MTNVIMNPMPIRQPNGEIGWKWLDETGEASQKTYKTEAAAERELNKYVRYLNHGPTRWQRFWWPIRYAKFWERFNRENGK